LLCQKKQKKKKKKEKKKVQNSSKKKKKIFISILFQKEKKRKISSFQSCFSKKIVPVPARKIIPFSLVSHLIQVLDLFMSFGCCSYLSFNIVSHLIQVDEFWFDFFFFLNCCWIILN
jgi:hypothetical protein